MSRPTCTTTRVAHFRVEDRMQQNFYFPSVRDMSQFLGLTLHELRGTIYNGSKYQKWRLNKQGIHVYKINRDGETLVI